MTLADSGVKVHPHGLCESTDVGAGTRVWAFQTVHHDLWDYDVASQPVLFTNDLRPRAAIKRGADELLSTTVRRGATLGAGAVVVCGVEIGENAFAAAGAVVTQDVPAHAFVAGNPARIKGWVCACGERLGDDLACLSCGTAHERAGSGLRATG